MPDAAVDEGGLDAAFRHSHLVKPNGNTVLAVQSDNGYLKLVLTRHLAYRQLERSFSKNAAPSTMG